MAMHAPTVFGCPEGGTPLVGLINEYRVDLVRRRRSERHVVETVRYLERLTRGVETLEELTVEKIVERLAAIPGEGRAQNLARVSLHALFEWLVRRRRVEWNPVRAIEPVHVVPIRLRRALGYVELRRLVDAVPFDRGTVYLVAATTGLRRAELGALVWGDVDLENRLLTVRAAVAKSRVKREIPLPQETVERLLEYRAKAPALHWSAPLFARIPLVKTLYLDLKLAAIDRATGEGVFDFHAFRVTYASFLEQGRVSVKVAQGLLGHGDPRITLNIYTRTRLEDARLAVDKAFKRRKTA